MEFNRTKKIKIDFNDTQRIVELQTNLELCNKAIYAKRCNNKAIKIYYNTLKDKIMNMYNIISNKTIIDINSIDEIYCNILDDLEFLTEQINILPKSILQIVFIREMPHLHELSYMFYSLICYDIKRNTDKIGKYYDISNEENIILININGNFFY